MSKEKLHQMETDLVDDDKKINTKKKDRGCLKSLILWLLFFLIGISLIGIYLGLNHPFFDIKYININGNSRIEDEIILSNLDFKKGDNVFKINIDESVNKLKKIEGVEDINIKKIIPNKINVKVKELFDIGYIKDGEKLFIIDKNGFVKKNTTIEEDLNRLIEFTSINSKNLRIGMNIAEDRNFKNLINAIRTKDFFPEIDSIDLGNLDESIIKFKDGLFVKFDNDDISEEMNVLEKLLKTIYTQDINAKEIILNIGEHPIVVQEDD